MEHKQEVEHKQEFEYQPFEQPVKKLRAEDVGYFDPEYQDGTSGPIANAGKHVIYRDIYVFVDRLKDVAYTSGHTAVRLVVTECLRGVAQMWFTSELTSLEKAGLRGADLQLWYTTLIDRFKMHTSVALATLISSSYSLRDLRENNKTPRAWIQDMLHYAKAANIDSTENQLLIIWNGLHVNLRRNIPTPTHTTTLGQFFKHIDNKTPIWQELAQSQRQYQPSPHQQQGLRLPPQQQQPQRGPGYQQASRGGDNRANQARFAPRIPIGDGKQYAFLADVTPDGYAVYQEDEGQEHYVGPNPDNPEQA